MTTEETAAMTIERCARIAEGTFTYGRVDGDDGTSDARARLIADRIRALAVVSPTPPKEPTNIELWALAGITYSPASTVLNYDKGPSVRTNRLREIWRAGFVAGNQEQEKTE